MSAFHQGSDDMETFDSESPRALSSIPEEPTRTTRSRSIARPPPRRGQITTVACSLCQQRKTKCDGRRPICGPCSKSESIKSCNWELPRGQKRSVFLRSQVTKYEEENENLRRLIVETLRNNIAARTRTRDNVRSEVEACVQDEFDGVIECLQRIEAAKAAESTGRITRHVATNDEGEDHVTWHSPSDLEYVYGLPGTAAGRYGEEQVEAPAIWPPTVHQHHTSHPHHPFSQPQSIQIQTGLGADHRSTDLPMTHPPPANMTSNLTYSQCFPERESPRNYYQYPESRGLLVPPHPLRIMGAGYLNSQSTACDCTDWMGHSNLPPATAPMVPIQSNYMHMTSTNTLGSVPVLATGLPWNAEPMFMHGYAGTSTPVASHTSWGYEEYHGTRFIPENPPSYESTPSAWSPHTPDSSIWTDSETGCNLMAVPESHHWEPCDHEELHYGTHSSAEPYLHGHEGTLNFGVGLRHGLHL